MRYRHKRTLTGAQQETLDAIERYISKHRQSPTIAELSEILHLKSQTIIDRIEGLRKKNYVRKIPHKWRNIELVKEFTAPTRQVPVVGNVGADNMSVLAEQEFDRFLQVDEKLLDGRRNVFVLRAMGNSMRDTNLFDGDYVIAEEASLADVNTGSLVIAIIGDNAVVKRLRKTDTAVILQPENNSGKYEPIIIRGNAENFRIIGRVIDTLRFSENDQSDFTFVYEE